jgi:2',3'-cyclic-nucleotide 2'-phosphodiesterase/3'-nucleotidase/5'-nucleotidase
MVKRRSVYVALMLLLVLAMMVSSAWAQNQTTITILGTSDLHGRLFSWDYAIDSEDKQSGFVKVASMIKEVRAENPNTIVVDNGDTIQDNMAELFNHAKVHPMVAALDELNYDAWVLGNHEFNFGMDVLTSSVRNSKVTVLAANIYRTDTGKRFVKPYKIITKDGVRVALIGMTNPHISRWEAANPDNFKGLTFTDPIAETQKVLNELKGKADVFIGVMHMGPNPEYGMEGSGLKAVAGFNPELTAIIAGHEHSDIPGTLLNGVLVVEPKSNGAKVSRIDLKLYKKSGQWTVSDKQSRNIDVAGYSPDPDIVRKFQYVHDQSRAEVNTVIGKITGDFLPEGVEMLPGIPYAQIKDTALVDFINEVQMYYTKADISAAALFTNSSNLAQGDFKKKDVANIYKYTNTLMAVKITGKQLKAYMEWSAGYYNTAKPGDVTISFNPDIRGYNYDMFSGVNYEINIAAPPGKRIENLTFKGKPVTEDMTFTLAVNNYRFGNMVKDGYFNESDKVYDSYEKMGDKGRIRDLIIDYVRMNKTIAPKVDNNWKITGVSPDHPLASQVYDLVKSGAIKIPTSADGRTPNVQALNVYELCRKKTLNYDIVDIVSINDLHGTITRSGNNVGIANLVNAIKMQKAANPDTIFVGAGDLYQGSAESNLLYGKPISECLKEAGMAASAIGNHEYDWGNNLFGTWSKEGGFPFLAANIYDKTTGKPISYVKPYLIVNVGGHKVAFIGLSTPETLYKTKPDNVKDVEFKDPRQILPQYIKEVRDHGAEVVIALTHLGAAQAKDGTVSGEATAIAAVPGLNAIIAGHTHEKVAGEVNGIPIVEAYYNGRSLGKLTFIFAGSSPVPVKSLAKLDHLYLRQNTLTEDRATKDIYNRYLAQVQPILSEKLGVADVDLNHDTQGPSLMGEWVCDIMRKYTGTQIGIQNGGGLRVSLPKGDLTVGSMYMLMPFDNTLVTAKLTGAQVKEAIENGIANPKIAFGQISGVYATYDLSRPFGQRVVKLTLENGQPLVMDQTYTVVANDFMFTGGDNYTVLMKGADIKDTGVPIRDSIIEYVKEQKVIQPVYKGYQAPVSEAAQVKPAA